MKTKLLLLFVILAIIFSCGKDGEGHPECLYYMSQALSKEKVSHLDEINNVRCSLDHTNCRETCIQRRDLQIAHMNYISQTIVEIENGREDDVCTKEELIIVIQALRDYYDSLEETYIFSYADCEGDYPPHN
ncbi:MAG TPA: hypothetical protein VIN10_08230 [Bacteroidales bacterium]